MKRILFTSLPLLTLLTCYAQTGKIPNSIETYGEIPNLHLKTSLTTSETTGTFHYQPGSYLHAFLNLYNNMTYSIRTQDCLLKALADSGTWSIAYDRMILLKSATRQTHFDVLLLNGTYYLVEPIKRRTFIQYIQQRKPLSLDFYSKPGVSN